MLASRSIGTTQSQLLQKYFLGVTDESKAQDKAARSGFIKNILTHLQKILRKNSGFSIKEQDIEQYLWENSAIFLDILSSDDAPAEKAALEQRIADIYITRQGLQRSNTHIVEVVVASTAVQATNSGLPHNVTPAINAASSSAVQKLFRFIDVTVPRRLSEIFMQIDTILIDLKHDIKEHDALFAENSTALPQDLLQRARQNNLVFYLIGLHEALQKITEILPPEHPISIQLNELTHNIRLVRNGLAHEADQKGANALWGMDVLVYAGLLADLNEMHFKADIGNLVYTLDVPNLAETILMLQNSALYMAYERRQHPKAPAIMEERTLEEAIQQIQDFHAGYEQLLLTDADAPNELLMCLQRALFVEMALFAEAYQLSGLPKLMRFRHDFIHQRGLEYPQLQAAWLELQQAISHGTVMHQEAQPEGVRRRKKLGKRAEA